MNSSSPNHKQKEKEKNSIVKENNMLKNNWNELRKKQFDNTQNLIIENFQTYVKNPIHSNRLLYTFLDDKGNEIRCLTFQQLDLEAKRVAGYLQTELNVCKGDRVILCFPPGLDFNISFWGCLYAGAIGVPVYPPYPGTLAQDLPRFNRLVNDSQAQIVLTNRPYYVTSKLATAKSYISSLLKSKDIAWPSNLNWIMTESISSSFIYNYKAPKLKANDIAFFQYSSGSTSDPKAVIVSYGNIAAQLDIWRTINIDDILISWLPSYHDMGLFGFCIVPALVGAHCVSMSPIAFIKDPAIWLRIVTKYKGTHICAPNFGYALAARKTTDADIEKCNLHSLKHALCAAEPIREETLLAFYNRFKSVGLRYEIFNCGYGLAEVTLVCAGQDPIDQTNPSAITIDKRKLEMDKIAVDAKKNDSANGVKFVNCGYEGPGFVMAIVDPETLEENPENVVGEIWVKGASVALGYWNRPKETKKTFEAYISKRQPNSKADYGPYLRTGDLGFRRDGCLYVTGRLKDLIIIRGRNICPQDVELTVEKATDAVRKGCIAAFSVEIQNEEKLIVVAELRSIYGEETIKKEIINEITMSILREHQLCPYSLVLLQPKSIPKTTSGKIQRNATKRRYLEGNLRVQYISNNISENIEGSKSDKSVPTSTSSSDLEDQDRDDDEESSTLTSPSNMKSTAGKHSPAEIEKWLMKKLTATLENQPAGEANMIADANTPWSVFGLDSITIVSLSTELGEYLDVVVPPLAFFEFETPRLLAHAPGLATGELSLTKNIACASSSDQCRGTMDDAVESVDEVPESSYTFKYFSEYTNLQEQIKLLKKADLSIPYLDPLTDEIRKMLNYNTYNYLGLAGHPEVSKASKDAIDLYGTTMSSSPIVGQTMINIELEKKICDFYRAESCVLFVGGWVANVTTIDALLSKEDLILCDTLNHNSCVTGQRLSGATVIPFPHNNYNQLEKILASVRVKYRRVMIVIEGVYSMDGDIPHLPEYIRIKKQYKAMLFLDEAHSFGTIGKYGRGMIEYFPEVNPADIDIRMGTLSKAMGSTGGFMIGCSELIDILKFTAGGFVFSVGLTPCNAASALQSIKMIETEPERVSRLQELSCYFYDLCVKRQLNIANTVRGSPVVVVIVGSSVKTTKVSEALRKVMINVKPIIYPGVEEGKGRLRFFLSYLRTEAEIEKTITYVEKFISELDL